jgi:hypothetical protein
MSRDHARSRRRNARLLLVAGGLVTVTTVLTGCADRGSTPGTAPTPSTSTSTNAGPPQGVGLRAFPVARVDCDTSPSVPAPGGASTPTPVAVVIPAVDITTITVCPDPTGASVPGYALTGSEMSRLLKVLAAPDTKPATHQVCAMYADLPILIFATTRDGHSYLLRIPVDGCGHYLSQVQTALGQLRLMHPNASD